MSPPELFEDVALHLLADLQRHQREGAPMDPTHDPLRFAAREHLRRRLTTVLDAVDMPEPTRTTVAGVLLEHADVHCEDRPEPDGVGLRLVHTAVLTIAAPYPVRAETAGVAS